MREVPYRDLFRGPARPDRVLFHPTWPRGGHRNPRYIELMPRLERLDQCVLWHANQRLLRGVEVRALRAVKRPRYRLSLAAAAKRYRSLLVADRTQIAYFNGNVVADCDNPKFTEAEVALLNRPNLKAYVTVNERVARMYRELGVSKPVHVIPHGTNVGELKPDDLGEVARRHRHNGDIVVGYMGSWLLSHGDRNGDNSRYNVDHLLDLWDEIHARLPAARLWMIGGASKRVEKRCADRGDIELFGRLPRESVFHHVANFDVAVFARSEDQNFQLSKIAEYMGCGVPTVAYDFEAVSDLRDAGAGLLVDDPRGFVDAVERLAGDPALRAELAAAARRAAAQRDWDEIAARYAAVLDRYMPAA